MKLAGIGKRLLIGAGVALLATPLVLLGLARLEMTPNGVHTRLLLPTGNDGRVGIHIYSGSGDSPRIPGFLDGPIVRRGAGQAWTATWFCEDRVHRQRGQGNTLDVDCAGRKTSYPIGQRQEAVSAVIPAPAKMLVLSDIEGDAAFLDEALRELGVLDSRGNWSYGSHRLVIAGDAVDRGRDVFAVLWRLYALSLQAAQHGGSVHVLLGNHEQYVLRGNISRANREHLHALERMGGPAQAFAADTVLGGWLRQQPVLLQAGKVLVAHAGISPFVASSGLSLAQLNDAQRRYWQGVPVPSAALDAVFGPQGVTQYRGYFEAMEGAPARASLGQVADGLNRFGVDIVVVGHTLVEQITPLYGGRVYAIDVNSKAALSEALLFEDGVPKIVSLRARRRFAHEDAPVRTRPLRLFEAEDWRTLERLVQRTRTLAQLPHPY